MIDRRDISYTQGSPLTPVHKGVSFPLMVSSTPLAKSGDVISRAKKPINEDLVANVIDVIKYGSLGLGGPILAAVEHAAGKDPTVISTGFGLATSAYGLGGAATYGGITLPAVIDKGIIGYDDTTTIQPKQVQKAVSQMPGISALSGTLKLEPFDLGLPSWDDIKTPLLIAGIVGAAALLLPSIIGLVKK